MESQFRKPGYVRVGDRGITRSYLRKHLATEEQVQEWLITLKWQDGRVTCLRCGSERPYRYENPLRFVCRVSACRHKFSLTTGTWIDYTKIPLVSWVWGFYDISEYPFGTSAKQIARNEDIKVDTARRMSHVGRNIMGYLRTMEPVLDGVVEGR